MDIVYTYENTKHAFFDCASGRHRPLQQALGKPAATAVCGGLLHE